MLLKNGNNGHHISAKTSKPGPVACSEIEMWSFEVLSTFQLSFAASGSVKLSHLISWWKTTPQPNNISKLLAGLNTFSSFWLEIISFTKEMSLTNSILREQVFHSMMSPPQNYQQF